MFRPVTRQLVALVVIALMLAAFSSSALCSQDTSKSAAKSSVSDASVRRDQLRRLARATSIDREARSASPEAAYALALEAVKALDPIPEDGPFRIPMARTLARIGRAHDIRAALIVAGAALRLPHATEVGSSDLELESWMRKEGYFDSDPPLRFETLVQDPDAAAVPDEALRMRIRETGLAWKVRHRASGLTMLLVPIGTYQVGASVGESWSFEKSREERASARIFRPFYLCESEVVQGDWERLAPSNPSIRRSPDLPVENVSWVAANSTLASVGSGLRLPREAEWEVACRAGTNSAYSFGDQLSDLQANFAPPDGFGVEPGTGPYRGAPIDARKLPANPMGFFGMHGNVSEWCVDEYLRWRVIRGGSWASHPHFCRSACRGLMLETSSDDRTGVRPACFAN